VSDTIVVTFPAAASQSTVTADQLAGDVGDVDITRGVQGEYFKVTDNLLEASSNAALALSVVGVDVSGVNPVEHETRGWTPLSRVTASTFTQTGSVAVMEVNRNWAVADQPAFKANAKYSQLQVAFLPSPPPQVVAGSFGWYLSARL
jgi:hypothetical protein